MGKDGDTRIHQLIDQERERRNTAKDNTCQHKGRCDDKFQRVETHRRRYIKSGIDMVDAVDRPEEWHLVIEEIRSPGEEAAREKAENKDHRRGKPPMLRRPISFACAQSAAAIAPTGTAPSTM